MQTPRNPSYGWSLVFAMTIAITSNAQAQTPSVGVVFKENAVTTVRVKPSRVGPRIPSLEALSTEQAGPIAIPVATQSRKTPVEPLAATVQDIERPTIAVPDAKSLPASVETRSIIDSRGVACRAACEWLPAKQLRQHAQSVQQLYCKEDDCTRQAAHAIARFLQLQAEHQQDLAAARALQGYYARAAIAEQLELLKESDAVLQNQRERQSALQEKGLAAGIDLTSLDREAITLNLQRLELQQRDRQLRKSLNDATRTQYDWEASSVEPLEVRAQTLDAEELERFALGHRRDLLALQCLSGQINRGTAPMLSSVINSATGMASLPLPKRCLVDRVLGRQDNAVLTNNLKESIAIACETQASSIRSEVSEKTIALELAYQKINLSQEATASWKKRFEQLQRLAKLGDSRPADLVQAQTSLLAAKTLEIERRLEAKLAEIELAEVCGGLASRCCHGLAWLSGLLI